MTGGADWSGFEIAIVGLSGRFPGAADVDAFWRNIRDGVECIRQFTEEELLAAGEDPAKLADPAYVKAASVLDDIESFDAGFFGITPREAELMDPQHRLFLESAWNCLEDAGFDPTRPPGPVGVYGGASTNAYLLQNLLRNRRVEAGSHTTLFGNQADYLTTRVSYKLNLKGPSFDVQTGCSSSLVAVHLAAQALLSGECDVALAGGTAVQVPHLRGYVPQEQGIYSPDGHCRAFSDRAQGTVGGSGVALVALRRLQDALDDGDTIHAIIRGSAINNDGAEKVGYAAPSPEGQAQVIANALAMADVPADSIGYVETHGTGTALGDPIEVAALTDAFRAQTDRNGFCWIGSLKTNIGHLDTAAGVAGLIKATLALKHRQLPPSLNCETPDPAIDFPNTPFKVNTELRDWASDGPRRAGVSSFGIGGTNAHVILEEPPASAPAPASAPGAGAGGEQLLVLSARTPKALDEATGRLAEHLATEAGVSTPLRDVAWTLQMGRQAFDHRRAVVATDAASAAEALRAPGLKRAQAGEAERTLTFLFPGQGSQYVNMSRGLYEAGGVFRDVVDEACALLQPHLAPHGVDDLRALLYPPAADEDAAAEQLTQTWLTQPALFVVEYALARHWMDQGLEPTAMLGHSIGEYVAATLAGVFGFEQALGLVAARGRLMQDLPGGSMLAVPRPADVIEPLLSGVPGLSLAAVNETSACVVSGPDEAIDAFEQSLGAGLGAGEARIACRRLRTSHAFHSSMMDPILEAFTEAVAAVPRSAPTIPFVSNLTGDWITDAQASDPAYWAQHLRQAVRFAPGVQRLLEDDARVFLEVGPGNTLTTLTSRLGGKRAADAGTAPTTTATHSLRHPREERADSACVLDALGTLWSAGVAVDWERVHGLDEATPRPRRVPLPTYPFQRQRFWVEPDADVGAGEHAPAGKLPDVADWWSVPSWTRSAALGGGALDEAGHWLVFFGDDPLGPALVERLRSAGQSVTTATYGTSFTALDPDMRAYELRAGDRADHAGLLTALANADRAPDHVLHFGAADTLRYGSQEDDDAQLTRGLLDLIAFGQAAGEHPEALGPDGLLMLVVSRGVASVSGAEPVQPSKATLLGACQALAQECPALAVRSVDLDSEHHARELDQLLAEHGADPADTVVAWRGPHRWVRRYEPVRLEAPAGDAPGLRAGGHYLVTGGLGSIGLEIADCLGRAVGARLTLLGRSDHPERDAWADWLAAHAADDVTSLRIGVLRGLEEAGAEVLVLRADVTDPSSMGAAIAAAEERFGPLHGVVHAAGAEKLMTPLADTTARQVADQLQPKLEGLKVLESLLAERTLDFCVVQSSLSSVLGALGMVGYVAAHHGVDAFVTRHNLRSAGDTGALPWTRVNWDNWLSWKEPEFLHDLGEDAYFMTPAEGAEAFRRVLATPPGTELVHSTGHLARRIAQWVGGARDEDGPADGAELHERPELGSDYAAPTSPAEQALVAAWGEVLGIGGIGVHDNFFELGGDSVLGLQIVSRVGQAGFHITPAQIFEQPTIAGLAGVATARGGAASSDDGGGNGPVDGDAPLLPIQRWFFELDVPDRPHFNLPTLLEAPEGADAALLEKALADVTAHHDALRLRYAGVSTETGGDAAARASGVTQTHGEAGPVEVVEVDLSSTPAAERPAAMRARATELHGGFDLERGPLQRAVLFHFGDGDQPSQLLWIVHHLLVDAVSWRTLTDDLHTAVRQRLGGQPVSLPRKTHAFQAWGRALTGQADSDATRRELDHWRSVGTHRPAPLPVDHESGADVFASARIVPVTLSAEDTKALLQDVPGVYETRIDEVLHTALVLAFARWTGERALLVDLEGHGREGLDDVDVSRTVGWFTTLYPARLDLGGVDGPGECLKAIKEQMRAIPRQGLGWGMLRYLSSDEAVRDELAQLPTPEVNFLYLGQFSGSGEGSLLQDASGEPCSPDFPRGHRVEIVGFVSGGQLTLEWSYSEHRHAQQTIQRLADDYLAELRALIEHCRAPTAGGRTPSDFPAAQVSQGDLDKLMSKFGKGKST